MFLVATLVVSAFILQGPYRDHVADAIDSQTADTEKPQQIEATAGVEQAPRVAEGAKVEAHRALAQFLAKRYSVSQEMIGDMVQMAYAAGRRLGLDPLLIIAVMAIESRFNPIAESVAGAKGLMQVIPKYHADKLEQFGGERAVFDPRVNILIGSKILKEYLGQTGNLREALQRYAGAPDDDQDIYTTRVLNEKLRLQRVVGKTSSAPANSSTRKGASSTSSPS